MKRKYEEIEKDDEQNINQVEPMEIDTEEEEYYTIENFIAEYIKELRKKKLKNKKK